MTVCEKIYKHKNFVIMLSAVLTALPLNLPGLFLLSFVSLAPLYILLGRASSVREAWRQTYLFGFIYHLSVYWWLFAPYPLDFAGIGNLEAIALLLAAWLLLSAIHALVMSLLAPLFMWAKSRSGIYSACLVTALWKSRV